MRDSSTKWDCQNSVDFGTFLSFPLLLPISVSFCKWYASDQTCSSLLKCYNLQMKGDLLLNELYALNLYALNKGNFGLQRLVRKPEGVASSMESLILHDVVCRKTKGLSWR
jgi:hypothetical protein